MYENFLTLEDLADEALLSKEYDEINQHQALIIRHGQSEGNIGLTCSTAGGYLLTEKGHLQADFLARFLKHQPSRIVHSPFIRTKLTANPTIKKFPECDVLEWPIQEFTYLDPTKFSGSTPEDRQAVKKTYWENADPEYSNGGGAESFADLWSRVELFRRKLNDITPGSIFFSHGQFMQVLMMQMEGKHTSPTQAAMREFRVYKCIPNTGRIAIKSATEISDVKISHLPSELISY